LDELEEEDEVEERVRELVWEKKRMSVS